MRVALFTRLPEVATFYDARLRELGHELVGVVTAHGPEDRYGDEPLGALVDAAPWSGTRRPASPRCSPRSSPMWPSPVRSHCASRPTPYACRATAS